MIRTNTPLCRIRSSTTTPHGISYQYLCIHIRYIFIDSSHSFRIYTLTLESLDNRHYTVPHILNMLEGVLFSFYSVYMYRYFFNKGLLFFIFLFMWNPLTVLTWAQSPWAEFWYLEICGGKFPSKEWFLCW